MQPTPIKIFNEGHIGNYDVEVIDISLIYQKWLYKALTKILQQLTDKDLSKIPSFYFEEEVNIAGKNVSYRTGYTGETA